MLADPGQGTQTSKTSFFVLRSFDKCFLYIKQRGGYLFFMIYYELLMCLVLSYVFFIQSGNKRSPSPQDLKIIIFICLSPFL